MSRDSFAVVIADLAATLLAGHIDAWASRLAVMPAPGPTTEASLIDARPGYAIATQARRLLDAWNSHAPGLTGAGVALALRAAAQVQERSTTHRTELVISGPTSLSVPVRLTSSVVTELIRSAQHSLLIVSFAAYGVADVIHELADAAARGVRA
jgi:cardiolipin synthase C